MFEKHIEALESGDVLGLSRQQRADMIALMRAAEPKEEAAERNHCFEVAPQLGLCQPIERAEMLMRERAAARAPLQAEINRIRAKLARVEALPAEWVARNARLNRQLQCDELLTADRCADELEAVLRGSP